MTDATTLGAWMRETGLDVQPGSQPGELWATNASATRLVLRPRAADVWDLVHERDTTRAATRAAWQAPDDERDAFSVLADIASHLARGHALVHAEVAASGDQGRIRLSAPVHAEGLCKQAFLMTLSSLMKVVEALDAAAASRAADLATLAELQAQTDAYVRQQQEEMAKGFQPTAPPPPVPAATASLHYAPPPPPPPPPPPAWQSSDGRR